MTGTLIAGAVALRWVSTLGEAAGLGKPCGIAVDAGGTIHVADAGYGKIVRLRPDGSFVDGFGQGEGGFFRKIGKLTSPTGVALDLDGSCWVADARGHQVFRFGPDGRFAGTIGRKGKADGEFDRPRSIRRDTDGTLWVVDAYNHRVQQLEPSGRVLHVFGHRGSDPAGNLALEDPSDLAFDADGLVYVTDTFNDRIQVFDRDGRFVRTFGSWGREPGQLIRPRGIAIDGAGRVWVTEMAGYRIQAFDREGRSLVVFGREGGRDGQFNMPYGIVAGDGELLVADNQNRRLVRLAVT